MNTKYKALLFAPDGDFVTDFNGNDKEVIWENVADMGSKWIFYPLAFIATDTTIVDAPDGLEHLTGKRISTVQKHIKKPLGRMSRTNHGNPVQHQRINS